VAAAAPIAVDPLKDVQATIAELEAELTSRKKALAERGWVLADLDAETAADTFVRQPAAKAAGDTPAAVFHPTTFDEAAQTIEAVASTFAPVVRRDARGAVRWGKGCWMHPEGTEGSRVAILP